MAFRSESVVSRPASGHDDAMSKRALRILVITPWVPYPVTGACQQDRFAGLQLMKSLGYDVQVIAKIHSFQDRAQVEAVFRQEKIPLTLTEHSSNPGTLLWQNMISVIKNPVLIDGSALEYADSKYQEIVLQNVKNNQPDVIWLEYTMLWPLLHLFKPMGIPLIMKSSLNEPLNCIDEHGGSILSRLKSIPKFPGEKIAATKSDSGYYTAGTGMVRAFGGKAFFYPAIARSLALSEQKNTREQGRS